MPKTACASIDDDFVLQNFTSFYHYPVLLWASVECLHSLVRESLRFLVQPLHHVLLLYESRRDGGSRPCRSVNWY